MERRRRREDLGLFVGLASFTLAVATAIATHYQAFGTADILFVLMFCILAPPTYYLYRFERNLIAKSKDFERIRLERDKNGDLTGRLIIGNTPNVAFRVRTVQELLHEFEVELGTRFNDIVRSAGRTIGEEFSGNLNLELLNGKEKADTEEQKVKIWASFDSKAGWGIFDVDKVTFGYNHVLGQVRVVNGFLRQGQKSNNNKCTFVEGYLEGVLVGLTDTLLSVEEIECGTTSPKSGLPECVFQIRTEPKATVTEITSQATPLVQ